MPAVAKEMKKTGGWMMFLGVLYLIAGTLCIILPLAAGVAVAWVIGIALLAVGIVQAIGAFQAGSFGAGVGEFLIGLLYVVAGVLVLLHPLAGLTFLTMLITVLLFIHGVLLIASAFQIKPEDGWGWLMFGGVLSIILAIMLFMKFPTTALWLPGVLVGVDLLFSGWTILFTGGAVRGTGKDIEKARDDMRQQVSDAAQRGAPGGATSEGGDDD